MRVSRLERMGIRFAGTDKERQAADWIEGRLKKQPWNLCRYGILPGNQKEDAWHGVTG